MSKITRLSTLVIVLAVLLSACGLSAPAQEAMTEQPAEAMPQDEMATQEAMMEEQSETMPQEEMATEEAMVDETAEDMMDETPADGTMMETPAWYSAEFVNAVTGEKFSLADFEGKVVLVETMAIWCTTCRAQQGEIVALHEQLGMREDFVSVTLDVDANENQDDLKSYVENNGFDWLYAVAPAEVSREIGNLYGDQFLNPPSAPILIIDRHAVAHPLPFGIKSANELFEAMSLYLEEM